MQETKKRRFDVEIDKTSKKLRIVLESSATVSKLLEKVKERLKKKKEKNPWISSIDIDALSNLHAIDKDDPTGDKWQVIIFSFLKKATINTV